MAKLSLDAFEKASEKELLGVSGGSGNGFFGFHSVAYGPSGYFGVGSTSSSGWNPNSWKYNGNSAGGPGGSQGGGGTVSVVPGSGDFTADVGKCVDAMNNVVASDSGTQTMVNVINAIGGRVTGIKGVNTYLFGAACANYIKKTGNTIVFTPAQ